MLSGKALEEAIDLKLGEKVTKQYMESRIQKVEYFVIPGTSVTVCHIELDNKFSVRGESACVDPTNYDEDIGRSIAYANAFDKLWPLFGFLLSEKRFNEGK